MIDFDEVFKILDTTKKIDRNINKKDFILLNLKENELFNNAEQLIKISHKLDYAMGEYFDLEKMDKAFSALNTRSYLYFFNFLQENPHKVGNMKHREVKKIDLEIKSLDLKVYFWVIRYKNEYYFAIPKKGE